MWFKSKREWELPSTEMENPVPPWIEDHENHPKKKNPRQNDNNNAKIIKKQKENQHFRAWKKFQKKNHLNSEKRRIDKQHLVAAAAAPLDELPGNKQSIALSNLFSTSSAISIALCVAPPPPTPPPPPPLKQLLWVLGDFWNKIFRVSKTKSLGFLAKCRKFLWLGALLANLKRQILWTRCVGWELEFKNSCVVEWSWNQKFRVFRTTF